MLNCKCRTCGAKFKSINYKTYCDECDKRDLEKQCLVCGKTFIATRRDAIRCADCRAKSNNGYHRQCSICGKDFIAISANTSQCPECKPDPWTVTCVSCGEKFTGHPNSKYCQRCKNEKKEAWRLSYKGQKKKKKFNNLSLSEISRLARKEGLTYGQFCAKYGL